MQSTLVLLFVLIAFGTSRPIQPPPSPMQTEEYLEIRLLFDVYTNDHYNQKFHTHERKWALEKEQLSYVLSSNSRAYGDTLELKKADCELVKEYVKLNCLKGDVVKDL